MLVKPILPSMSVIDANNDNRISFVVIGGDQFTGYTYEIINNQTLEVVVERNIVTTTTVISLESYLLTNGSEYRLRIKTSKGSESSEYSDYIILKCYKTAEVTINNLIYEDNIYKVKNQRYIFEGTYTQEQGVMLKGYYYVFYDNEGSIIKEYPISYQQSGTLVQIINTLNNNTYYKIRLVCVDQNDIISSSDIIPFYVEYTPPRIRQILSLKNNKEDASVDISCDVRQLIFNSNSEPIFKDGIAIDLLNEDSFIYMDDSFTLNNDFWMQFWIDDLNSNADILSLEDRNATVSNSFRLFYNSGDKRFHVRKTMGEIIMEYISDVFELGNPFSLYIKQEDRRVDIIPEILG